MTQQQAKTLDQQIKHIFGTITGESQMPQPSVRRVTQLLKVHLQDVLAKSLKRTMWRDPNSSVLDQKDILHVISKMDDKYKYKVGQAFLKMTVYKRAQDRGNNLKNYKHQQVEEADNSDVQQSQDIQSMMDEEIPVNNARKNKKQQMGEQNDSDS